MLPTKILYPEFLKAVIASSTYSEKRYGDKQSITTTVNFSKPNCRSSLFTELPNKGQFSGDQLMSSIL